MSHDTSPVAGMATGSLPQLCMKMSAIPICGPERRLSGSSNSAAVPSTDERTAADSQNCPPAAAEWAAAMFAKGAIAVA